MDTTILDTMSEQIGRMNILAISGGRRVAVSEALLVLPVSNGYRVEVEYMYGSDDYTVRRTFTRSGKRSVKGEVQGIYCDQLGEAAYQASCFRDGEWGQRES